MKKVVIELLITVILVLSVLICSKKSIGFKTYLYKNVYNNNISFLSLSNLYNKYLGDILPFKFGKAAPVFSETLTYSNIKKHNDSYELDVDNNYLVPSLESGIVIFVGEKILGSTVIIMGEKETWYSNINPSVKLYDYVEKSSLVGDTLSNKLYLTFKKDGEYISFEEAYET